MIKNDYKIFDSYVILYIRRKNNDLFELYIDLEDLKLIDELNWKVHVKYFKTAKAYYGEITIYLGIINGKPRYKSVLLHRLILGIENPKINVDHIDFNSLNNRVGYEIK